MIKIFPIFLLLLFSVWDMQAQEEADTEPVFSADEPIFDLTVEMEMGFPIRDFKHKIDKGVLWGKGIGLFYHFEAVPVEAGLRFGGFSYDHTRRKFDSGLAVQKTKNKIWIWTAVIRGEPDFNLPFKIYFEGTLGLRRYYSHTYSKYYGSALFSDEDDDGRFDEAKLNSDWGMVYSGAVGVKILLEKNYGSALDFQFGLKQSRSGYFLVRNDLSQVQEEPIDNYNEEVGSLSMLSFRIGLSLPIFPD
ncbi:MAG: hypothetical protein KDC85_14065 [Saprospiraceae bacterium]|nr:hypothetical protein [Saprospiraceae bacterium]MCB9323868.1 hypothetical protein [Lewinellaceae bacterium]